MNASPTPADPRLGQLRHWLASLPSALGLRLPSLRPASSDASFRRYFRIDGAAPAGSWIAMDAPPPEEDCKPFVHLAGVFREAGLNTPRIAAADFDAGFLLLSDFGSQTYDEALRAGTSADALYPDALSALVRLQKATRPDVLADYDAARLAMELALFPTWYLDRHLGQPLQPAEARQLQAIEQLLIERLQAQPQTWVHRDWHVRNLMVVPQGNPGVLDFQGALTGPMCYDLVSLLRDAYVDLEESRQLDWAVRWWQQARAAGLPVRGDIGEFWIDFEWTGLQRHLKVLGIFARLHHRDGKPRYLDDLPRVLGHVRRVVQRYRLLAPLQQILDRRLGPSTQVVYSF